MALKIVRNDIVKMQTEAIVNPAGETPDVGDGCEVSIYMAAGYEKLHALRKKIGNKKPGDAFITPGFDLSAEYIIHVVTPRYVDGESGEEQILRKCYRECLRLAKERKIHSIAFPLLASGWNRYTGADALMTAMDEIRHFPGQEDLEVYLVVFDTFTTLAAEKVFPGLEAYIDRHYVRKKREEEYGDEQFGTFRRDSHMYGTYEMLGKDFDRRKHAGAYDKNPEEGSLDQPFGVYCLSIMKEKGLTGVEVQNRAWIMKSVFSRLKTKSETYRPDRNTALRLCVGLGLNTEESKSLLERAGFALSSASMEDVIWSYGIEKGSDIFDISDMLAEHGFPPIVNF